MKKKYYFPYTRKPVFKNVNAINYDNYWSKRGFSINKKLKAREEIILKLIKRKSKIIDIGCGNSLLPIKLKEMGHIVKIADISKEVLAGYKKYNITGEIIDLEKNNINFHERFDYIILSEVLEHMRNPEEIINRLKRHTKFFIITIPNSAFYKYRLHLMFKGRFFTQWVYHPSEHLRFWSHVDFLDWLKAMDLEITQSIASNGFSCFGIMPNLKNIWKNLLGHQICYLIKCKFY